MTKMARSTLLMVKMEALGTLVSCSLVIFFSPSKSKNDSNVGGAFMVAPQQPQERLLFMKNTSDATDIQGFRQKMKNYFNAHEKFAIFKAKQCARAKTKAILISLNRLRIHSDFGANQSY